MTYSTIHLDQQFAELQTAGLNQVHAAMAKNIIQYRIRGELPYTATHLEDIITKIQMTSPEVIDRVKRIFKNAGA